ncbi:MAG TPA: RiPP maturation radical SAM C-methyltransferase [Thermoanaerobaculia bacterium]|nr:RiPP maturation radical SAM C-methyltransferase [Thermoanaerobaculia bacterium]
MLRISLVNMPFSSIEMPSIALTQLQGIVHQRLGFRASVEVCYASHDACRLMGLDDYRQICNESSHSGLGDWLFRLLAFPQLPDNVAAYQQRYFPAHDPRREAFERLLALRPGLGRWLDGLIERYRLDQADLVGLTSMFGQNVASFALARRLKERYPRILTAIGGANCESPMGEEVARNVETIDYVFSGPALISFPQLIESLLAGDDRAERIDGVFTRANLAAGATPVALIGAELDIDEEVPLDYEPFLRDFETAFAGEEGVEPTLMFETSRGCWWGERAHCTFCGLNGSTMSFRWMKPEKALALIRSLFAHFPRVRRFNCVDNIMPKEYPREVFARLDTPPGASLFYEVKADLSEEDIALLSAAGVDGVQPGIEALATSTLKLMRKGMTSVRNVAFLQHCLLHDVHPAWNLLVGFPGETEEVFKRYVEVFPRLVHLPPPAGVFPVRFDRFSPYFTQAAGYGLDLAPLDFYPQVYPFAPESLARLAYYFTDRNVKAPYFLAMARWIGRLYKVQGAWADSWAEGRPPVLCFERPGGRTVRDSRSGSLVVHDVGEGGRRLLDALAAPTTLTELAKAEFDPPLDVEAELAWLRSLGLLFEDGDRLISLVLPHEARPERLLSRYAPLEAVPA